jgi:hypothetical protein
MLLVQNDEPFLFGLGILQLIQSIQSHDSHHRIFTTMYSQICTHNSCSSPCCPKSLHIALMIAISHNPCKRSLRHPKAYIRGPISKALAMIQTIHAKLNSSTEIKSINSIDLQTESFSEAHPSEPNHKHQCSPTS